MEFEVFKVKMNGRSFSFIKNPKIESSNENVPTRIGYSNIVSEIHGAKIKIDLPESCTEERAFRIVKALSKVDWPTTY